MDPGWKDRAGWCRHLGDEEMHPNIHPNSQRVCVTPCTQQSRSEGRRCRHSFLMENVTCTRRSRHPVGNSRSLRAGSAHQQAVHTRKAMELGEELESSL